MKVKITGPDGKTYRIDVPEGSDPEATVDQFGRDMGWNKNAAPPIPGANAAPPETPRAPAPADPNQRSFLGRAADTIGDTVSGAAQDWWDWRKKQPSLREQMSTHEGMKNLAMGFVGGPMRLTGPATKGVMLPSGLDKKAYIKSAPAMPSERTASERLSQAMQGTYRSEKAMVTPAIEAAKDTLANTAMPTNVVRGYSNKYLNAAGPVEAAKIPMDDLGRAMTGKTTNFGEVDKAMSLMKDIAREMLPGSQQRLMVENYIRHMSDMAPYKAPGVKEAYSQYAQFKGDFDKNPLYGELFRRNPDKSFKLPASKAGEAVSKLSAEGQEALTKFPAIRDAMTGYANSRKSELVQKTLEDAKRKAPNFSASGYENAIRTEFRHIATNTEKMALFNATERAAIDNIAKGGFGANALRFLGRFAPTGPVTGALHALGIQGAWGSPLALGAAVTASGATGAARAGARHIQGERARLLDAMIRHSGKPIPVQGSLEQRLIPGVVQAGRLYDQ